MIKPQNRSWFSKAQHNFFDDFGCKELFSLLGFCLIHENKCLYQCMGNSKITCWKIKVCPCLQLTLEKLNTMFANQENILLKSQAWPLFETLFLNV
jgi:hypothetical protein